MKTLTRLFVLCLSVMIFSSSDAQVLTSNRPYLFKDVNNQIPATISELDKAFTVPAGTTLQLRFNNFLFNGTVTSSIKRYDKLYSVIIHSPSLHNTLFSISRRINDDNTITYVGRILNEQYADGFELVKNKDGSYLLNKTKTDEMIQDY
ncbi:MAG: hypothetical protein ACMG51_00435 [Ginsengibacter sp.]